MFERFLRFSLILFSSLFIKIKLDSNFVHLDKYVLETCDFFHVSSRKLMYILFRLELSFFAVLLSLNRMRNNIIVHKDKISFEFRTPGQIYS